MALPTGFATTVIRYTGASGLGSAPVVTGAAQLNDASVTDVADAIAGWVNDHMLAFLVDNMTVQSVEVKSNTDEAIVTVGSAGGQTGEMSPPNLAVLCKKLTGAPGRANRGRNYWPGILADSHVADDGTIKEDPLTDLSGLMGEYVSAFTTAGADFALLSGLTTDVVVGHVVTSYIVESVTATQRRRLRS